MTRVAFDIVEHTPSGRKVVVSTINRESSSMFAHGSVYAETKVFEFFPDEEHWGSVLATGEASEGSRYTHDRFVAQFRETGTFPDD